MFVCIFAPETHNLNDIIAIYIVCALQPRDGEMFASFRSVLCQSSLLCRAAHNKLSIPFAGSRRRSSSGSSTPVLLWPVLVFYARLFACTAVVYLLSVEIFAPSFSGLASCMREIEEKKAKRKKHSTEMK